MGEGERTGKGIEQIWHLGSIFVSSRVVQQCNKCWHLQWKKNSLLWKWKTSGRKWKLKEKKEYLEYPHGTEWVERNHSDA